MHYRPLFSNPALSSGECEIPAEISAMGLDSSWQALCEQVERQENDPSVLASQYENSDQRTREQVVQRLTLFSTTNDPQDLDAVEALLAFADDVEFEDDDDEIIIVDGGSQDDDDDDFVGPVISDEDLQLRDDAIAAVQGGLATVFPGQSLENHDIFFVLIEAVEAASEVIGEMVTDAEVANALTQFGTVSFPKFMPEELISLVVFEAQGTPELADADTRSRVSDDSRPDAICSPKNVRLVKGAFGEEAASNLQALCNAPAADRISLLMDVHNGSLPSLLGVDSAAYEQFLLDSFNNQISDALVASGSKTLDQETRDLVRTIKDSPKTALVTPPTLPSVQRTRSASESHTLADKITFGVVALGAIASSVMLARKARM